MPDVRLEQPAGGNFGVNLGDTRSIWGVQNELAAISGLALVAGYTPANNWTASIAEPSTASITVDTNDVLVTLSATEDFGSYYATPTGGTGITWTQQQAVLVSQYCSAIIYTALPSAQSFTQSLSDSNASNAGGFRTLRFSGSSGIGASNKANADGSAPTLSLTTQADNSAIAVIVADWSVADGSTRTWNTVNSITPTAGNGYELDYYRSSVNYTVYTAYYPDVGTAGSKTVGLSVPSSMKYSIAAVEIKKA